MSVRPDYFCTNQRRKIRRSDFNERRTEPRLRDVPQDGHASRKRPSTARKQLFGSLMLSEVKKLWRPTGAWFANDDPCRPREPVHLEGVRSMGLWERHHAGLQPAKEADRQCGAVP